jgi:TP901 family phage tail tape measure protein
MAFTPGMEQSVRVNVESGGAEQFMGRMDGVADSLLSIKGAVGVAGAALAGLAAGALAESISQARKFEDAMVEVRRVTAEGVGDKLTDDIKQMAANIPIAREELASVTADAARFGVEGEKNIQRFATVTAKMATATDLNTNRAGEALAKLATITQTPMDEVEKLGSSINSLGNTMATSQSEIVEGSLRASAQLSNLGASQTEIFGLQAALNEVSPSARRAGTRLRRVAQGISNPKNAQEYANALGMSVEEFNRMKDQNPIGIIREMAVALGNGGERADKMAKVMNKRTLAAMNALSTNIDGLDAALKRSNEEFEKGESLQDEFETKMNTFSAQLTILKNRFANLGQEIGKMFLDPMTKALKSVNDFLKGGGQLTGMIDEKVAAFGLLGTIVGGTAAAIVSFTSVALSPLLGVIAAVGAAIWALKNNFAGVRDAVMELAGIVRTNFSIVKDIFLSVVSDIQSTWNQYGGAILANFESIFGDIKQAVMGAVRFIQNNVWKPALKFLNSFWDKEGGSLLDSVATIFLAIQRVAKRIINGFEAVWAAFGDEIVTIVKFAFDAVGGIIKTAVRTITTIINVFAKLLKGDWKGAFDEIVDFASTSLSGLFGFIKKWGGRVLKWLGGLLGDFASWAGDVAGAIVDGIVQGAKDAVKLGKQIFNAYIEFMKSLPGEIMDAFSDFAVSIGGRIKQAINNALGLPREITIGDVSVQGNEVFSGKTFTIPALAEGGIVNEPTMAMVGEAGSEAVIPLDKLEQVMGGTGGGSGQSVAQALADTTFTITDASFTLDGEVVTVDKMEARFEQEGTRTELAERRKNTRRR